MTPLPAYIDPGSGSLIIQAVIAAIIAVPIFLRSHIGRAVRSVRGTKDHEPTPGDDTPAST